MKVINWYVKLWGENILLSHQIKNGISPKEKNFWLLTSISGLQSLGILGCWSFICEGAHSPLADYLESLMGKKAPLFLMAIMFLLILITNYFLIYYKNRYRRFVGSQEVKPSAGYKFLILVVLLPVLLWIISLLSVSFKGKSKIEIPTIDCYGYIASPPLIF